MFEEPLLHRCFASPTSQPEHILTTTFRFLLFFLTFLLVCLSVQQPNNNNFLFLTCYRYPRTLITAPILQPNQPFDQIPNSQPQLGKEKSGMTSRFNFLRIIYGLDRDDLSEIGRAHV